MTALELFTTLHASGVIITPTFNLGATDDAPLVYGLHVNAPVGVLTETLRAALREQKAALLDLVEAFEERAAIAEYDGGLSRADAEGLAWCQVMALRPQNKKNEKRVEVLCS